MPVSLEGWQEQQEEYSTITGFPTLLHHSKSKLQSLGMAQAELHLVCSKHHKLEESTGGCLDQTHLHGSASPPSLLQQANLLGFKEQNPVEKAGGGELALLFLDVHDNTAQKTGHCLANRRFIYTANQKERKGKKSPPSKVK